MISAPDGRGVDDALRRGVDRLLALASEAGWSSFRTLAGDSDIWVTSYVTAQIGPLAARRAKLSRMRRLIAAAQRSDGGWSFGGEVPSDADSTSWALLALEGTRGLNAERRASAGAFLELTARGAGYATYCDDGQIAAFINAGDRSVRGWTSEHSDVTAAVLLSGPPGSARTDRTERLQALVDRQDGAGWWPAYWWRAPQYTTLLVLRALRRSGHALPAERAERLLNALEREQLPDGGYPLGGTLVGDPFVTALALEALTHLRGDRARAIERRAAAHLLSVQLADGGWAGNFQLRIPPPDQPDPRLVGEWTRGGGGGGSFVLDRDGTFASAQACAALRAWTARRESNGSLPELPARQAELADAIEASASTRGQT